MTLSVKKNAPFYSSQPYVSSKTAAARHAFQGKVGNVGTPKVARVGGVTLPEPGQFFVHINGAVDKWTFIQKLRAG